MVRFGSVDVRSATTLGISRSETSGFGRRVGSFDAAQQASILFFLAGLMTITMNHLPDADGHAINDWMGVAAVLASPLGWILPWRRWPERTTLVYVPFCFALLVVTGLYGSIAAEIYGVWYVVTFVWIGLHHPPRTPLLCALPASIAYLIPLLAAPDPSGDSIRSVGIAVPAAVLIGELLASTATALREARAAQDQASHLLAIAAVTDDLTGLGNRRRANTLVDGMAVGDAVLILDLDHFKAVNDRHGHRAGDELLTEFAGYLAANVRGGADRVARYGGEEFLIVLRQPGPAVVAAAERLLAGWRATKPAVTFSIGLAVRRPDRSPSEVVGDADAALYRAKAAGRDRCFVHAPADRAIPALTPTL